MIYKNDYGVLFILECMPGYVGLNCTTKCPYSTYGERCQGYCYCSNNTCDVSLGCEGLRACTFVFIIVYKDK